MESLINYSIQLNLYLILLLACYQWGIRQSTNFQMNRLFLLVGIAFSMFLPILRFNFSPETFAQIPTIQLQESIIQPTAKTVSSGLSYSFWLLAIYLSGVLIATSRIIYGVIRIYKLKKSCLKTDEYYKIPNSTAAFSFLQNIFIGENISEEQKAVILQHEKVNLRKLHMIDLLVLQLLEAFLFYNPFIYRFNSLFREIHEYEADHYSAEKKEGYITHLLSKHFDIKEFSIVHQFNSNHIKSRIMRIKNQEKRSAKPAAIIMSILLFGGVFLINQNSQAQNKSDDIIYKNYIEAGVEDTLAVDQIAKYQGGDDAFMKYIIENTKYPKAAKEKKISGTVFVEFVISLKGDIQSVKMLRGIEGGEELNREALRVIESIPEKWKPAMKDGKAVAASMVVPIKFKLPKEK